MAWVKCRRCGKATKHQELWRKDYSDPEDPSESENWVVYECQGCETPAFVREMFDNYRNTVDHQEPPTQYIFPEPPTREAPPWKYDLPSPLPSLFDETYKAASNGCYALAAMGTRSIIDRLLTEKLGDIGGFEQKLKKAENDGLITKSQLKILNAVVELGSASQHRGHIPSVVFLESAFDIVENIVAAIYILPEIGEALEKDTPPRRPR